jgi:hypothetical protein
MENVRRSKFLAKTKTTLILRKTEDVVNCKVNGRPHKFFYFVENGRLLQMFWINGRRTQCSGEWKTHKSHKFEIL